MSELWYDDHRKDAESFSVELILYNYGEDLQVLRERIALLERTLKRITLLNDHNFQLRDAMEIAEYVLQEDKPQ
jgi:hypothetical protein